MAVLARVKTWISGETLTASDLNAEFDNLIAGLAPASIEDDSSSLANMRSTSDPYTGDTAQQATTLSTELRQIRFQLDQIIGKTYWYEDPATNLETLSGMVDKVNIWIPAGAMIPLTTNGAQNQTIECATNDIMLDVFCFDTTTKEYVAFNIAAPHGAATLRAEFFAAKIKTNSAAPPEKLLKEVAKTGTAAKFKFVTL